MSQSSAAPAVNPLAAELNNAIEKAAPEVLAMLSSFGRRLYFPKGILTQSAEAKAKAHRFNATIGIATEGAGPMYLPSIQSRAGTVVFHSWTVTRAAIFQPSGPRTSRSR